MAAFTPIVICWCVTCFYFFDVQLVSVEVKGEETSIRLQDLQKEMENLQRQLADLSAVHGRVVNELSSQSRNASTLREKLDEQVEWVHGHF